MRRLVLPALVVATLALAPASRAGSVVTTLDFEGVPLGPEGYYNGSDGLRGFDINGNFFNNAYEYFPEPFSMEFWAGWAVTNHADTQTEGFGNQYSAIAEKVEGGPSQHAVIFNDDFFGQAYINLAAGQSAHSITLTNTAYTYYSIKRGDSYADPFGEDDYFLLTITGYEGLGGVGAITNSVSVYLADYRDGQEFALDTWETFDLASLAGARSLGFTFSGGVDGEHGPATPPYVAVSKFQTIGPAAAVPEPAGLVLLGVGVIGAVGLARRAR